MKKVIDGTLDGLNILKDKSAKMVFVTQELSGNDFGELATLHGQYCKILISTEGITKQETEAVDNLKLPEPDKERKYNSKWLRAVLFRTWEGQGSRGDFQDFYEKEIERIGKHYIEKYLD